MPSQALDVAIKQRSYQKQTSRYRCECAIAMRRSDEHKASEHEASCFHALCWIVRVPFTSQAGEALHGDSARMNRCDAVNYAAQYAAQGAQIIRVWPLHQPRAKRKKAAKLASTF